MLLFALVTWSATPIALAAEPVSHEGESGGETNSVEAIARGLRAALERLEAGASDADAGLAEIAAANPLLADQIDALRLAARVKSRDPAASVGFARERIALHAGSPLLDELEELAGDLFERAGESSLAREARERALTLTQNRERAAKLRLALGRDAEARGDPARASQYYLALWRDRPASPAAIEAGRRLELLEAADGVPRRGAADWRKRGLRLGRSGANEEALHALDTALALGLGEAGLQETRLARAHTLFRLRRYTDAEAAFAALPIDEARLQHARSIARQGEIDRAVMALLALAEAADEGRPETAAEARWLAATLLDDEEDGRPRARTLFRRVAESGAAPARIVPSLWWLGWSAYRDQRPDDARAAFARMAAAATDPIDRLQAQYWSARAAGRGGDEAREREDLATIAREQPLTYYGWRAATRLAPGRVEPRRARAPEEPRRLPADALLRARVLLGAGLHGRARDEVHRLTRRGAASASDRLALAALLAEAGEPHAAQRLALVAFGSSPTALPEPSEAACWRLLWPRAFESAVTERANPAGGVPPSLIWAIMREESGYRPDVVSPSGARGLLQLMPETGARLAREAQLEPFDPQALFEPPLNIRLGALYLGSLMRRFDGRASAAVGSYNAGPEAVARWLARRGNWPDDEWVEAIPYEQTRGYVKRVLRSLHAYEILP